MEKSEFLKIVSEEINNIKNKATKEEKNRLNFEGFRHQYPENCIYGQMTGRCDSSRAEELTSKTLESIYVSCTPQYLEGHIPFEYLDRSSGDIFTPLEQYLYMSATKSGRKSKMHREIIEYIKGERATLVLK